MNCFYGVEIWNICNSLLNLFVRCYFLCKKKFFGFSKFERNRDVPWLLNMMSPRTLLINSSFKANGALLNFANFELAATALLLYKVVHYSITHSSSIVHACLFCIYG